MGLVLGVGIYLLEHRDHAKVVRLNEPKTPT